MLFQILSASQFLHLARSPHLLLRESISHLHSHIKCICLHEISSPSSTVTGTHQHKPAHVAKLFALTNSDTYGNAVTLECWKSKNTHASAHTHKHTHTHTHTDTELCMKPLSVGYFGGVQGWGGGTLHCSRGVNYPPTINNSLRCQLVCRRVSVYVLACFEYT